MQFPICKMIRWTMRCLLICFLVLVIASVFLSWEKDETPFFTRDAKYKFRISEQNVQRDGEMEMILINRNMIPLAVLTCQFASSVPPGAEVAEKLAFVFVPRNFYRRRYISYVLSVPFRHALPESGHSSFCRALKSRSMNRND